MSGDERFERELRAGLRDLASQPAPERLVSRVASIPFDSPAFSPRRSLLRLVTGLGTAAVFILVVGVVIVMRPGGPSSAGAPGASASPSQPGLGSSTPAASALPSVAPSAGPSLTASLAPTATAVGPVGGPVPAGLQVSSVTFASPELGWALGTAPCAAEPCTSIVRTADGGLRWVGIPAPVTPLVPAGIGAQAEAGSGVGGLRFANARDGWAFGPDLWATHDGGSSWRQLTIPGAASATVVALETSGGSVQAALFDQNVVRIASSPVGSDGWRLSDVSVPIGAGPVAAAQLVLAGTDGWLLEVDRTVVGGARLSDGAWATWTPPCVNLTGPAVIAASGPTELVAACDVGLWSTPLGEHLYVSHDGGAIFAPAGTRAPINGAVGVASTGASTIFLAGSTAQGSAIVRSGDGGQTWHTALETGKAQITYLGFTTPAQGVALTTAAGGAASSSGGSLLMTRDGGQTWRQVTFAGQ